jgi:hypothetical protein
VSNQFTIRLKNEPSALANLARALADNGIDIRTIGAGAVGSFACVVLSTNNDAAARDVLKQGKYSFVEGEALTVALEDQPGSFARLTGRLAEADVSVLGVVLLGRRQGKAELALSLDPPDRGRRVLGA